MSTNPRMLTLQTWDSSSTLMNWGVEAFSRINKFESFLCKLDARLGVIEDRLVNLETQMQPNRENEKKQKVVPLHPASAVEQGWATKNLKLDGFRYAINMIAMPTDGFDIPLIVRKKQGKIDFDLQWVGNQVLYEGIKEEISLRIRRCMKLFFKKMITGEIYRKSDIPKNHIKVTYLEDHKINIRLTVDDYFPFSSRQHELITIGLEDSSTNLEPDIILLEDCITTSRSPRGDSSREIIQSSINYLMNNASKYQYASWYPRLTALQQKTDKKEEFPTADLQIPKSVSEEKHSKKRMHVEPSIDEDELSIEQRPNKRARVDHTPEKVDSEKPEQGWEDFGMADAPQETFTYVGSGSQFVTPPPYPWMINSGY